jgi:hypothetical protein
MPGRGGTGASMKHRIPYTYVLLRYRHDPLAGEFANVGVVLHAPQQNYIDVRVRKTLGRLGRIFPGLGKGELTASLSVIAKAIRRVSKETSNEGLFRSDGDAARLAARAMPADDSSYIWSNVHSGLTSDPSATLDQLYERFVGRYDEENVARRDDAAVWQPVRDKLSARNLLDRLEPKTIVSALDEVKFDSAWKNGAWHCYQALSFDLTTAEGIRDKAARWSGHMLGASRATEDVKPYFLVGAPAEAGLVSDFNRAIELLRASALDPVVFVESQIDDLVQTIADEMGASRGGAQH